MVDEERSDNTLKVRLVVVANASWFLVPEQRKFFLIPGTSPDTNVNVTSCRQGEGGRNMEIGYMWDVKEETFGRATERISRCRTIGLPCSKEP